MWLFLSTFIEKVLQIQIPVLLRFGKLYSSWDFCLKRQMTNFLCKIGQVFRTIFEEKIMAQIFQWGSKTYLYATDFSEKVPCAGSQLPSEVWRIEWTWSFGPRSEVVWVLFQMKIFCEKLVRFLSQKFLA